MPSGTTHFDSEGFDLGAAPAGDSNGEGEGIIYEVGGGVTTASAEPQAKRAREGPRGPTDESERLKELGNDQFRVGNYLDACDYYTDAIEACPCGEGVGPSGIELLKLREDHEGRVREVMVERRKRDVEKRRTRDYSAFPDDGEGKEGDGDAGKGGGVGEGPVAVDSFSPPRHIYGHKLAVYYANRAATLLHLGRNGEAIEDCDVSLLLNPTYVKAYLRRCTAFERVENTEDALKDAQKALELEPSNAAARKNVKRLEKIESERMERLKVETMGKLKDLGNSLLGNFGLSLDNFNAVQDPKTGGYSISFNQNVNKK